MDYEPSSELSHCSVTKYRPTFSRPILSNGAMTLNAHEFNDG